MGGSIMGDIRREKDIEIEIAEKEINMLIHAFNALKHRYENEIANLNIGDNKSAYEQYLKEYGENAHGEDGFKQWLESGHKIEQGFRGLIADVVDFKTKLNEVQCALDDTGKTIIEVSEGEVDMIVCALSALKDEYREKIFSLSACTDGDIYKQYLKDRKERHGEEVHDGEDGFEKYLKDIYKKEQYFYGLISDIVELEDKIYEV